ncbi:unnamed protein product [Sphenostylis stenocarpa]|uniref:CHCH domain-containing protein n=1 Tax=Sphenostylis stenocarpa TaxID=92480 RepID=A0AA86VJ82_9FABA|nr:unnamed protein product [Sphenostylis stenocarpa]
MIGIKLSTPDCLVHSPTQHYTTKNRCNLVNAFPFCIFSSPIFRVIFFHFLGKLTGTTLIELRSIFLFCLIELQMSSTVDSSGNPIPSSSVLMASSKHIGIRCHSENLEFLKCKKKDQNPEKCLDKGRNVTRCVLGLLKDLHQKCTNEMNDYVGCMYYHTNEFDLCRKEQQAFEQKCSLE